MKVHCNIATDGRNIGIRARYHVIIITLLPLFTCIALEKLHNFSFSFFICKMG